MTNEEFATYLDSLPPEVRAAIFETLKPVGDYAAQPAQERQRVQSTISKDGH